MFLIRIFLRLLLSLGRLQLPPLPPAATSNFLSSKYNTCFNVHVHEIIAPSRKNLVSSSTWHTWDTKLMCSQVNESNYLKPCKEHKFIPEILKDTFSVQSVHISSSVNAKSLAAQKSVITKLYDECST